MKAPTPSVGRRLHVPRFRARRFRDRLLIGMLVVALLPLATFAAIVVADVGAINSSTVDATHQAILRDARDRQMSAVAERAHLVDSRLAAISAEVQQIADQLSAAKTAIPHAAPQSYALYRGLAYATADGGATTLLVSSPVSTTTTAAMRAPTSARAATVGDDGADLLPLMQGLRRSYPEVAAVWIADTSRGATVVTPAFDVADSIRTDRLDTATALPVNEPGIFSASEREFETDDSSEWTPPDGSGRGDSDGPFWTDAYTTLTAPATGFTVWLPVSNGTMMVGADVELAPVAAEVIGTPITQEQGAYPLLVSSANSVLASSASSTSGIAVTPTAQNATPQLTSSGDRTFTEGMSAVEGDGHPAVLSATLGGVATSVFATPIYSSHWVLATLMPTADLEPDVGGITAGVEVGIRHLLLEALPLVLVLCAMAFLLATILARRLVLPVRALTTAAGRLADGHTEEAVPPQGSDEVGVLAASLERMRRELNSSRDTILATSRALESRVRDRTAELRARNEELVALNELAGSLTESLAADAILGEALAAVHAVVPMALGYGFLGNAQGLILLVDDAAAPVRQTDADDALCRIAAAAADERHLVRHDADDSVLLGLPLLAHDAVLGALALRVADAAQVERALPLLRAIADQVGLALQTSQLSAHDRDTAVLEERTRLAREIHDTLAQKLTAIVLQLETADALGAGSTDTRAQSAVGLARNLAREALGEARRSVWDLRPAPLVSTGLQAALEAEVTRWEKHTGIAVRLVTEELPRVTDILPFAEVAILRMTQEALSNVAKHSHAERVDFVMRANADELVVSISDNGDGFDVDATRRSDAFGLIGMEERARIAGIRLTITSAPGGGTRIVARVPLATSEPQITGAAQGRAQVAP